MKKDWKSNEAIYLWFPWLRGGRKKEQLLVGIFFLMGTVDGSVLELVIVGAQLCAKH